jgi:hypothetical protein
MRVRAGYRAGRSPFPLETAAVWALFAVVATEIFVTYSRLPPTDLYHVSGSGLAGGASRVLVFANWPLALVSIPVLVILAVRMASGVTTVVALVGIVLSAAIFWPGMVKDSNLDARPTNAIAGLGVLVALALTVLAAYRLPRPARPQRQRGDVLRCIVAAAALVLSVPWIAAESGLSFDGVPVLGMLYQTGELRAQPGVTELHPAVHAGHHHGMGGALLVLSALLLSRLLPSLASSLLRGVLGAYLALMLCYGAGNVANDVWLEQVVKRGWTDWEIPGVTTPRMTVAWGMIVLAAAAIWVVGLWRWRRRPAAVVTADPEPA